MAPSVTSLLSQCSYMRHLITCSPTFHATRSSLATLRTSATRQGPGSAGEDAGTGEAAPGRGARSASSAATAAAGTGRCDSRTRSSCAARGGKPGARRVARSRGGAARRGGYERGLLRRVLRAASGILGWGGPGSKAHPPRGTALARARQSPAGRPRCPRPRLRSAASRCSRRPRAEGQGHGTHEARAPRPAPVASPAACQSGGGARPPRARTPRAPARP
jgi:hypothetical protein